MLVRTKITTTKEVTKLVMVCDYCNGKGRYSCTLCRKDLCRKHTYHDYSGGGDYSTRYCLVCWEKGESFRAKMVELEQKLEQELDQVELEWAEACGLIAQ